MQILRGGCSGGRFDAEISFAIAMVQRCHTGVKMIVLQLLKDGLLRLLGIKAQGTASLQKEGSVVQP
jgi:hypothetical protein